MLSPEEQIDAIVLESLDEIGRDLVFAIQLEISDLYPPSSAPATPPHLRSGNLQRGMNYTVDQFHDGYTLTIVSSAEYSQYLRDGTGKMAARDFMGDAATARYADYVVQRLQAAFYSTGDGPSIDPGASTATPSLEGQAA